MVTKYRRAISGVLTLGLGVVAFLVAPAQAQITFHTPASTGGVVPTTITPRTAGTVDRASAAGITPGLPTGTAQDDLLIAVIHQRVTIGTAPTMPSGWNLLYSQQHPLLSSSRATVYWKRAGATETAPLICHSTPWSNPCPASAAGIIAQILGFSNVDWVTGPWDVTASAPTTSTATTNPVSAPGITPVTESSKLVFVAHMADNLVSISLPTPASSWTQAFFNCTSAGLDDAIAAHYSGNISPANNPLGPFTATVTTGTCDGATSAAAHTHGALLAIRAKPADLSIPKPGGALAGDVMIASIAFRSTNPVITAPAGWTLVRRINNSTLPNVFNGLAVYWKQYTGEAGPYIWAFSPAAIAAGGIQSFGGVDTTNPIDLPSGEGGLSTGSPALKIDTPSVTTTVANAMLVTSHATANLTGWLVPPSDGPPNNIPSGMTQGFQTNAAGAAEGIQGSYAIQAVAGLIGAKSAYDNGGNTADNGVAHILALRPACGAVGDPASVAANAQIAGGQVTVYWSSANPVVILRNSGAFTGQVPANSQAYIVGNTGGPLGTAVVAYVGSGTSFTETPSPAGNYYYKVFAYTSSGPCYSSGTVNTTDGVSATTTATAPHAWSYALVGGGALAAPLAGNGTLWTPSNANKIVSLNTANGTQSWQANTSQPVQAWLSWIPKAGWTYRKSITIGTVTGGPHTDFPVLISRTDPDLQSKAQAGGNDIFFTSSDGTTKLSHEIENYDGATGTLLAWVKVPSLSTGTVLYMYYGNATAASQESASAVWSNGYTGVWHLKENPAGAAPQMKDSTSNANYGTSVNSPTQVVAAKIGAGLSFGVSALVGMGDKAVFEPAPNYSWSMWIWGNSSPGCLSAGNNQQVLYNADTQFNFSWSHYPDVGPCPTTANSFMQAAAHNDSVGWKSAQIPSPSAPLSASTWYNIVATYDGTNLRVYLNGALQSTAAAGAPQLSAGALEIGNHTGATNGFAGQLDEVRVGSAVRSAGWIQTEYSNQNSPASFHTVGAEQLNAGGSVIAGDQGTGAANSAKIYSVDATSGAQNWTLNIAGTKAGNGADVVVASASAQLWAYSNAAFQTALQTTHSYTGDVLYVATRNTNTTQSTVYALKTTDGTVLWNFNCPTCPVPTTYNMDWIIGQPVVDYARNRVYVASKAGTSNNQTNLWIINSVTGALVQSLALGAPQVHLQTSPSPSYDGNTLYVSDISGNLYAINLTATPPVLKWAAPAALGSAIKDTGFVWGDYADPTRFYFSTASGHVWCLQDLGSTPNVTTPCPGWSAVKTAVPGASTVLLLNKLFVSSWNGILGQIYQLNPATGAIEKQVTVGDGTKQPGDLSSEYGNEIFVGTSDGKIFKFPLTGGSL